MQAPASPDRARCTCNRSSRSKRRAEGTVRVLAASTEIGQGTNTIFSQIAADALGIDCDDDRDRPARHRAVPDSGPTVASRTCMVVGKLVEIGGARRLSTRSSTLAICRRRITRAEFAAACERYVDAFGALQATSQYQPPPDATLGRREVQGDAYGTYAWAVYVAEVTRRH